MPTKQAVKTGSVKAVKSPIKVAPKTVVKKGAKKPLVSAENEQCFWVSDGQVLGNLVELRDALAAMSDDTFAYHVGKGKNDFAEWIEHVLTDAELASAFRKSKKQNTAREVVITRLRVYDI